VAATHFGKNTLSCGCLRVEHGQRIRRAQGLNSKTHGMSHTNEYMIWAGIKQRCYKNEVWCRSYKNYGGRGIKVCDRWMECFENFYEDMGPRPSKDHSVERKDNNKDYSPENCYWGTRIEQGNNRRNNRMITIEGVTLTKITWCRMLGITHSTVDELIRSRNGRKARFSSTDEAMQHLYFKLRDIV
jgi:hypothetical protein